MTRKLAELTMQLACGGRIVTYISCKSEKDLQKKLKKRYKGGKADFGHFKVNDESVLYASYEFKEVH